ncbi:MAG: alpha/beta hydrolase [Opitutus sp.]|nr:alpha/beta hydrolase [Opitutus sp.]
MPQPMPSSFPVPFFLCVLAATVFAGEPARVLKVWPDGVAGPKPEGNVPVETVLPPVPKGKPVLRLVNVSSPELLVFPAPKAKATGTAVVILPGGGFAKLAMDLEGTEVAEHLNALGVTAFVLKYRTLPEKVEHPALGPAMDAQRAVSLVRQRAAEFGVRPDRIGMLGISAGGQSALIATSNHAHRLYAARADVDQASCRPDFLALVYPWKIQDANDPAKLRDDVRVDATMPPVFIGHAADDPGAKVEGSVILFSRLKAANVPCELHIYQKGGHGFGLRPADTPCPTDWPKRLEEWIKVNGW